MPTTLIRLKQIDLTALSGYVTGVTHSQGFVSSGNIRPYDGSIQVDYNPDGNVYLRVVESGVDATYLTTGDLFGLNGIQTIVSGDKVYISYTGAGGSVANVVYTTGNQTINGNKIFNGNVTINNNTGIYVKSTPGFHTTYDSVGIGNYDDFGASLTYYLDAQNKVLSGNWKTITPTLGNHIATKQYVDTQVALGSGSVPTGSFGATSGSPYYGSILAIPTGSKFMDITFPNGLFASPPSIYNNLAITGDNFYGTKVSGITNSGYRVYFTATILEPNSYLHTLASITGQNFGAGIPILTGAGGNYAILNAINTFTANQNLVGNLNITGAVIGQTASFDNFVTSPLIVGSTAVYVGSFPNRTKITSLSTSTEKEIFLPNKTGIVAFTNDLPLAFKTTITSGSKNYWIPFSSNFSTSPTVTNSLELSSISGSQYVVNNFGVTISGYYAVFSNIVMETGLKLHTIANL